MRNFRFKLQSACLILLGVITLFAVRHSHAGANDGFVEALFNLSDSNASLREFLSEDVVTLLVEDQISLDPEMQAEVLSSLENPDTAYEGIALLSGLVTSYRQQGGEVGKHQFSQLLKDLEPSIEEGLLQIYSRQEFLIKGELEQDRIYGQEHYLNQGLNLIQDRCADAANRSFISKSEFSACVAHFKAILESDVSKKEGRFSIEGIAVLKASRDQEVEGANAAQSSGAQKETIETLRARAAELLKVSASDPRLLKKSEGDLRALIKHNERMAEAAAKAASQPDEVRL